MRYRVAWEAFQLKNLLTQRSWWIVLCLWLVVSLSHPPFITSYPLLQSPQRVGFKKLWYCIFITSHIKYRQVPRKQFYSHTQFRDEYGHHVNVSTPCVLCLGCVHTCPLQWSLFVFTLYVKSQACLPWHYRLIGSSF